MIEDYFTKFIPVIGKITKGSYIFWRDEYKALLVHEVEEDGTILYNMPGQHDDGEYGIATKYEVELVALLLCTRHVEVGDDVYAEPQALRDYDQGLRMKVVKLETLEGGYRSSELEYIANPLYPHTIGHVREWPATNLWKPYGGISPDATWVKEGDTFTKEEVLPWHQTSPRDGFPLANKEVTNRADWESWLSFYKLKGPCGHFH